MENRAKFSFSLKIHSCQIDAVSVYFFSTWITEKFGISLSKVSRTFQEIKELQRQRDRKEGCLQNKITKIHHKSQKLAADSGLLIQSVFPDFGNIFHALVGNFTLNLTGSKVVSSWKKPQVFL